VELRPIGLILGLILQSVLSCKENMIDVLTEEARSQGFPTKISRLEVNCYTFD